MPIAASSYRENYFKTICLEIFPPNSGTGDNKNSDSDVTNELHFTLCEEKFPGLSDDI